MYARYNIDNLEFWKNVRKDSQEWYDAKNNLTANYYNIQLQSGIMWVGNYMFDSTINMFVCEGFDDFEIISHADIDVLDNGYSNIIEWRNNDFE